MGTQLHSAKGAQPPPQFSANVCCGQTAGWSKDATWNGGRPRPRRLYVRWGPSFPPIKGAEPLQFSAHVYCGQMDQDGTWHGGGPWSRPHCARWGPSSPPPKGDRAPQFSSHFYCGQTAECIKVPLGTEVSLSAGDFALHGDPAPPQKEGGAPNFWPMSIVAKQLDGSKCHLGHVGLCSGDIALDGDPAPPPPKRSQPPIFGPRLLWPNGCMYQDTTW